MGQLIYLKDYIKENKNSIAAKGIAVSSQVEEHKRENRSYKHQIECLRARYGDKPPRGGVIYKSPTVDDKLDSYGRGCVHNSVFQYMPDSKEYWNRPMPFPSDLKKVFKFLHKNKGKTIQLGYKSDPFMWMDCKYGITKKIIKYATRCKVKLEMHTMSDLCAHDDYMKLIKHGGHSVILNMSMWNSNEYVERLLSPGAPSLKRRQQVFEKLLGAGIPVTTKDFSISELTEKQLKEICRRLGCGIQGIELQIKQLGQREV